MNILVTGATGFIGGYLTEQLVKDGHQVYALVRKTGKAGFLNALGVNLIYGDITDEKSLEDILQYKIDVVFHCAAYVNNDNQKKLYNVNVLGTEHICNLCLKLDVEKLVYLSSVAVVSGNENTLLTEDLPYCATNRYGASKIEAEKKVIESREKGLRVAILRPPVVYGEGEPHALHKILFLLSRRLLPFFGKGNARWHLVYVKNVVDAMIMTLTHKDFLSNAFFVADEEVLTVKEIFTILSEAINAPLPYTSPLWLDSLLLKTPYIGKKVAFLLKERVYDLSRIQSFGFRTRYHIRDCLPESARFWLRRMERVSPRKSQKT